jgi:hypothetical protein
MMREARSLDREALGGLLTLLATAKRQEQEDAALPERKKGGQRKGRPCCDTAICIIGESSRSCAATLPAWKLSRNFGIVVIVVLVCAE